MARLVDSPRSDNTNQGKMAIRYNAHNRKPGAARFWKTLTSRKRRRGGSVRDRDLVAGLALGYMDWMFKS